MITTQVYGTLYGYNAYANGPGDYLSLCSFDSNLKVNSDLFQFPDSLSVWVEDLQDLYIGKIKSVDSQYAYINYNGLELKISKNDSLTTPYIVREKVYSPKTISMQYMTWTGTKSIGKTSGAAIATIQFPDSVNTVHSLLLQNQDTGIYLYPYSLTSVNFIVYGRNFFTGTTATCSNLHVLAFTS